MKPRKRWKESADAGDKKTRAEALHRYAHARSRRVTCSWDSIEDRYQKAEQALSIQQYELAIQILEDVVQDCPTEALFRWRLAYAYLDSGNPTRAIELFGKAIELDSESKAAWGGLGQAYMALAEWDRAEHAFQQRLRLRLSPHIFVFLAKVLAEKKDLVGSVQACLHAVEMNPRYDEAWFNLGVYYHMLGQGMKAQDAFAKAIALDPAYSTRRDAIFNRADIE